MPGITPKEHVDVNMVIGQQLFEVFQFDRNRDNIAQCRLALSKPINHTRAEYPIFLVFCEEYLAHRRRTSNDCLETHEVSSQLNQKTPAMRFFIWLEKRFFVVVGHPTAKASWRCFRR